MSIASKTSRQSERHAALQAIRRAVIEGLTWHYDALVQRALAAGATEDEIDLIAHDAVQALLSGAEEPLTPGRSGR
jgi:hypothetical protein